MQRLLPDELLDPISPQQPAGINLRWQPEWDRVKEARQSEDGLEAGKWAKRDPKSANWRLALDLSSQLLRERSKDLQLAMWLTEANLKLHGFAGLRDGLWLVRELIVRYWDAGLYPEMEDGPEDRAGPIEWLSEKVVDSVLAVPITVRSDSGADYSTLQLRDARLVGSEKQYLNEDGEVDGQKKREYDKALAEGRISLDLFQAAVRETRRAPFEELYGELNSACDEFQQLEKLIDEKFGDAAPNVSTLRNALKEIAGEANKILEEKKRAEPAAVESVIESDPEQPATTGMQLMTLQANGNSALSHAWAEAQNLVRSGNTDAGLAEMRRLAASETTGRNRFERKLLLAEICISSRRERLARAVLEELGEQIEHHHLESWESSELVSRVWSRLHEIYQRASETEEAGKLYGRLCRLDPWQALGCGE